MRTAIFIFLTILSTFGYTQDLTGIWRGSFVSSDRIQSLGIPSDRYKLEVQIDQHEKAFNSVTYSYKTTLFYGKATATGTVNPKTGKVWLEELKIVELKMMSGSACVMTYKLQYSKNDSEEFLEGTWTGYGEKDSSFCGKGTVLLHKVPTSDFYKEPFLANKEPEKKTLPEPRKKIDSLTKKSTAAKPPATTGTRKPGSSTAKTTTVKPSQKPTTTAPVKPPVLSATPKKNTGKPPAGNPPVVKGNPNTTGTGKTPPAASKNPPLAKNNPNIVKPPVGKKLETDPIMVDPDSLKKSVPQVKKSAPVIIPKVLANRENELIKTITINTNEITINIYDNGTIDHDTISVYLDKKLVLSKQMLTTTPLTLKFTMDDNDDVHELVMVAENEGDIPPNTSLMVVKAGDKEFEVRITSTEQKNAVVVFKYEKPK